MCNLGMQAENSDYANIRLWSIPDVLSKIGFVYVDIIGTCVAPLPCDAMIDVTVFSVTMRRLRKYSRARMHQYLSPLLNLLYRDAFMFFIVSIMHNGLTIALWTIYTDSPKYFLSVT
ncbi:hypothetical protein SERLADRAFT_395821, partial [Serpula lacrymans var. lacrymans S7.9]